MTFKPGAFIPGAPIQPIVLRFNGWDTYTWTFGQKPTNLALLLFLSLSQPVIRFTMEYLPVYKPNATERQDPMLYARNVRSLMAKHLQIPVSDWTFENGFLLDRALQLGLQPRVVNFDVHKLCKLTGLSWRQLRALLVEFHSISQSGNFSYSSALDFHFQKPYQSLTLRPTLNKKSKARLNASHFYSLYCSSPHSSKN